MMATQRGYYREELIRAKDAIEKSLLHLARVKEAYRTAHPDVSKHVEEVGDALVLCGEAIQSIHDNI